MNCQKVRCPEEKMNLRGQLPSASVCLFIFPPLETVFPRIFKDKCKYKYKHKDRHIYKDKHKDKGKGNYPPHLSVCLFFLHLKLSSHEYSKANINRNINTNTNTKAKEITLRICLFFPPPFQTVFPLIFLKLKSLH